MLPKSASLVLAVVLSSACLLMVQEVKTKSISESIDIDDFDDGDCDNHRLASGTDKPADIVTSPDDYHLMMQDLQGQDLSQQNEALKVLNDLVFNESSKSKEENRLNMIAEKNKPYTFYFPAQRILGSNVLFYSSVCAILFLVVNFVRNHFIMRRQRKEALAIASSIGYY
ncbi:hypothetical protein TYRP_016597 [Tyrophagus putrescentiae]|nr:hypothetical protein TYRP_016597 [Tyrophagus putrescentiae]